jgi:arabinofuranosyltransferase
VLLLLAAAIVASAWLCDDAYITFRTVDNFTSGEGLRWNVAERVQSYTHPLWMFAISAGYLVSGEVYSTSLLLSLVCSMLALGIVVYRVAASSQLALLAITPLLLSKAFVDYSTSGLENPLTHLSLALFFWTLSGPASEPRSPATTSAARGLRLALAVALIGLNRLDALLLVAPASALFLARDGRWRSASVLGAFLLGLTPLIAWEIFSLVYYGFPFPNTAYAKLGAGVPRSDLAVQGLRYLGESLTRDPVALVAIAAGFACGFLSPSQTRAKRIALVSGIPLYLVYLVWIGGDFMSGRLLTAPLFCAAISLSLAVGLKRPAILAGLASAFALALAVGLPTLTSGPEYGSENPGAERELWHGIGDERAAYYPHTGLLRRWLGLARVEDHVWALRGQAARKAGLTWAKGQALGLYGFYAGPRVHIMDMVGLSDPLLARLPARPLWRIGHFERRVPQGYVDTLRSGSNRIADPDLSAYYDALSRLVRDPVLDGGRLVAIGRFNLGASDPHLARYRARQAELQQ